MLLSMKPTFAQFSSNSGENDISSRNIIKLNFTPLMYRTISVQYERLVGAKTSFTLGINYMPKGPIPFSKFFEDKTTSSSSSTTTTELQDLRITNFTITPEFRYYINQAGKGFYFSLYGRYRNLTATLPYVYLDNNNQKQSINLNGNLKSPMLGIMIGSQFRLSNKVTLDWYILGAHIKSDKFNISATSSVAMTSAQQEDARKFFADKNNINDTPLANFEAVVTANSIAVKSQKTGAGLSGFGLALGFRF
jgi:hypothetical protein